MEETTGEMENRAAHRGGQNLVHCHLGSPLDDCPHLPCFLLSLPKTRKDPIRESDLALRLGVEVTDRRESC